MVTAPIESLHLQEYPTKATVQCNCKMNPQAGEILTFLEIWIEILLDILSLLVFKTTVFWYVTPYSLVDWDQYVGGTCCRHIKGRKMSIVLRFYCITVIAEPHYPSPQKQGLFWRSGRDIRVLILPNLMPVIANPDITRHVYTPCV